MSEGNNYHSLKFPALNGDSVDIGLVNLRVENDDTRPTTPGSRELRSQKTKSLKDFLAYGETSSLDEIKKVVTAEALCNEVDPIDKAFEIHEKLCYIANTSTEKTRAIIKLADRVEDFAYDLLDQVGEREEKDMYDQAVDRHAALFNRMTKNAIAKGQKKFVSHPFIFKRVERRWKLGLSERFRSRLPYQILLFLIMTLDAILTPVLLPFTAYVAYKDQQGHFSENSGSERNAPENKRKKGSRLAKILVIYRDYVETPYVIFMKTQFMQLVFIGLLFRISMIGSFVAPTFEEYLILVFFLGFVLNEIQQYRHSASNVYFRDMWNYLDVSLILVYTFVFGSRVATTIIGGDPFNNRLLELANYGYGFVAMFLILRFSSILELSSVIGPLQRAIFHMYSDLLVILVQFGFVNVAFSLAITKCYKAETSFLTPSNNGSNIVEYCVEGSLNCFYKSARELVWSIFGMSHFEEMKSISSLTSGIVVSLYLAFLVLSVIMLVNVLIALLTTTYDKYKTNADTEWKFSRAVVEEQYSCKHVVVVPFNIISEPSKALYFTILPDIQDKHRVKRKYEQSLMYHKFFEEEFFPRVTARYLKRYKGSFPLTVDRKLDTVFRFVTEEMDRKDQRMMDLEGNIKVVIKQLQRISNGDLAQKEAEDHITGAFQKQNSTEDDGQDTHL